MEPLYDQSAAKKPTNLSVNSDLLKKSKAKNINLSATLEQALTELLAKEAADSWLKNNKNAIEAYNDFVEEQGCLADEYRQF